MLLALTLLVVLPLPKTDLILCHTEKELTDPRWAVPQRKVRRKEVRKSESLPQY